MKLGIFGSSIMGISNPHNKTRTQKTIADLLLEKYDMDTQIELCHGIPRCSEERILFYLKKSKHLDVAVIVHSRPEDVFFPCLDHDFKHANYGSDQRDYHKSINHHINRYKLNSGKTPMTHEGDGAEGILYDDYIKLVDFYRENFYHLDLQRNRFMGALIQIDQYLTYKKIPAVHFVYKNQIPKWFSFTSGIVDDETAGMQFDRRFSASYQVSNNGLREDVNVEIAAKIDRYITTLLEKQQGVLS